MAITHSTGLDRAPGFEAGRERVSEKAAEKGGVITASSAVAAAIGQAQERSRSNEKSTQSESPASSVAVAQAQAQQPDIAQQQAEKAASQMARVASDYDQHLRGQARRNGFETAGLSTDQVGDVLQQSQSQRFACTNCSPADTGTMAVAAGIPSQAKSMDSLFLS